MSNYRIGVVAGCLKAKGITAAVASAREVGVDCLQVPAAPPGDMAAEQAAAAWKSAVRDCGLAVASAVTGFPQESYKTIETIHATGGLVPDDVAEENVARVIRAVQFTAAVGAPLLTFHAGFIPENKDDPVFAKLIDRLARCADAAAGAGVKIGLESGQESARALLQFLAELGRPNVGVNFDPANLILYGRQNPLEAVDVLKDHILQVHAKDGKWSDKPGVVWGKEVPLGSGDVQFNRLIGHLRTVGYRGDLIIEREAGANPIADISGAVRLLRSL